MVKDGQWEQRSAEPADAVVSAEMLKIIFSKEKENYILAHRDAPHQSRKLRPAHPSARATSRSPHWPGAANHSRWEPLSAEPVDMTGHVFSISDNSEAESVLLKALIPIYSVYRSFYHYVT
ncbi:hypothetical protein UY3_13573 [Chelonia mydas]|uniref:Uncharacterized protein n=1 Tax=Chelonia mydas TaxID=8469 RepID=M7AV54_CHEMY|nr:hypothetical protein UY3_13573 [Chelonia mydas]